MKTRTVTITQTFRDGKATDKVSTTYVCEYCDNEVKHRHEGAIFYGNVNAVEKGKDAGGLIGNCFPNKDTFSFQDIVPHVVCRGCVDRVLWGEP